MELRLAGMLAFSAWIFRWLSSFSVFVSSFTIGAISDPEMGQF